MCYFRFLFSWMSHAPTNRIEAALYRFRRLFRFLRGAGGPRPARPPRWSHTVCGGAQQLRDSRQRRGQEVRRQDRDSDRRSPPVVPPDSSPAAAAGSVRPDPPPDHRCGALRAADRRRLLDRRVRRRSGGSGPPRGDRGKDQEPGAGGRRGAHHLLHRLCAQQVARQDRRGPGKAGRSDGAASRRPAGSSAPPRARGVARGRQVACTRV